MKDHEIAAFVTRLTNTARNFGHTEQLRVRISEDVADVLTGPAIRLHASQRVDKALSDAWDLIARCLPYPEGRLQVLSDLASARALIANGKQKKPSRRHLASLLAAEYFEQVNTAQEREALNAKIERALKNFNIATGEFEKSAPTRC